MEGKAGMGGCGRVWGRGGFATCFITCYKSLILTRL